MSAKWSEVPTKKRESRSQPREETFFLLESLSNGGCMRCMNKSCKITEKHGLPYPDKICTFIQNPTYINGMEKSIKESKLDFNGKIPFFTTCNYINGKCRNCEEGRIKYISFNKEKIAVCYPILEGIRHKVTVGMHIDIKMVMKGSRYEITLFPLNINIAVLQIPVKSDPLASENFPSLVNEGRNIKVIIDTKHIDSYATKAKEDSTETQVTILVKEKKDRCDDQKNPDTTKYSRDLPHSDSVKPVSISDSTNSLSEQVSQRFPEDESTKIKFELLSSENLKLKKKLSDLQKDLNDLKEKNIREMFIIKSKYKYAECSENIKAISDRVSQQFFDTNYSDYIIAE
jgi:hypothetical protein